MQFGRELCILSGESEVTLDGESKTYVIKNSGPVVVHPPTHPCGEPFVLVNLTGSPFAFGGLELADGGKSWFVWLGDEYTSIQ